ncbi:MAG: hypothetical protein JNK89_04200, partial [Saprospiraceae bacterium]|nr:hypothetical protein [Saprospiraceae bacterium]
MALLIMEQVPVNPWYNVVNPRCTVRERPEPDNVLPPVISGVGDAPFNMQRDQPLHVQFEWSQNGFFSGANLGAVLNFEIKFLFESWGSVEVGPALDLSAVVPYQAGVGFNYNFGTSPATRLVIPPN